MKNIFHIYPNWFGTGLSNQLIFIIYGIIYAILNNKSILIIDEFRLDSFLNDMTPMNNILDFNHLNYILKKYNIEVFDKSKINFKINNVLYGNENLFIDITKKFIETFISDNKLFIPKYTNLNSLQGDPLIGIRKKFIIEYQLNDKIYMEEYDEYIQNDIIFNLDNPFILGSWDMVTNLIDNNKELYEYLVNNIKYNSNYYKICDNINLIDKYIDKINIIDILNNNKKINVIHLRLEFDMIYRMANNDMSKYQIQLNINSNKYIDLINKYIDKNDIIFILSYDRNNPVIKYLNDNGYDFYLSDKYDTKFREPNAIIDMILAEKCNNVFIGYSGSTFSYFIDKRLKSNVKSYFCI